MEETFQPSTTRQATAAEGAADRRAALAAKTEMEQLRTLNRLARYLASAATLVAAAVLVMGWLGSTDFVVRLHSKFPAMVPGSALGLVFGGLGVLGHVMRLDRRLSLVFGLLVFCVLIAERLVGALGTGSEPSDAMSIATRTGLFGLAVALSLDISGAPFWRRIRVYLVTLFLSLMTIPLIAYLINADSIWNSFFFSSIALHTALCLLMLFAALLLGNARGTWVMILAESGPGSAMARRMLPVVIVSTLFLCSIAMRATQLNLVSSDFRLSVLAFAQIAIISAAVLYFAKLNNQAEQRVHLAELRESRAEAELLHSETARLQTEVDIARTQRMETLGRLVGGVAHDVNNVLNVINGNLQYLEKKHPEAFASSAVQDAITAARDGNHLTHQLLAYGRQSSLSPGPCPVDQVAQQTLEMFERVSGKIVTTELSLDDRDRMAILDSAALRQALLNLLLNARDAMPEGGTIRVTVGRENVTGMDPTLFADGEGVEDGAYVTLAVQDSGTGITPDVLKHVTEPFFSTKKLGEGSGLGLSMVLGFCRQSGGNLSILTAPGDGATVTMWLPAA